MPTDNLDAVIAALFWLVVSLTIITIFLPIIRGRRQRLNWILPISVLVLYGAYEVLVPDKYDIRSDLVYLWPVLGIMMIVFLIKMVFHSLRD